MNLAEQVLRNRYPGRIALICGEEQVGWDELAARVARAAGALRSLGVQPGQPVLFVMRDTPDFAAAWLGAVHAGAVAVALNSKLTAGRLPAHPRRQRRQACGGGWRVPRGARGVRQDMH